MKFTETLLDDEVKPVKVVKAELLSDFKIFLIFDDSHQQIVDFYDFLRFSKHESTRKFLNQALFQNFSIVNGNLNWNDYEMCFPIWDLYIGNIVK